jgi:hypothetical protein
LKFFTFDTEERREDERKIENKGKKEKMTGPYIDVSHRCAAHVVEDVYAVLLYGRPLQ